MHAEGAIPVIHKSPARRTRDKRDRDREQRELDERCKQLAGPVITSRIGDPAPQVGGEQPVRASQ